MTLRRVREITRARTLASALARSLCLPLALAVAASALAQAAPATSLVQAGATQQAAAPATPAAPPADRSRSEPLAAWHVAEDEHVRVQELRVRGESRQITVQPKLPGARPYEIAPASGAIDPSQRGRLAPGTSQWRVLNF